jgi:uncharacterized protein
VVNRRYNPPMANSSRFEIPITTLANGHCLSLHVHELSASTDGPVLLLVAGVMGDQPTGVETARRLVLRLERENTLIKGQVLVLPVANPYAYQQHSRHTPLDMNNLNRLFPGRPEGLFSEQLAAAISDQLLSHADVLVALHSGGTFETTRYTYSFDDIDLAASFGTELILPGPSYPGTLALAARERDLPVVVGELGGHAATAEAIKSGIQGVMNVLRKFGMAEGEMELPSRQLYCPNLQVLRARHGGILLSDYSAEALGESVPAGARLGAIISPYTFEQLETLVSPFAPSLLALTREPVTPVEAGDYAFIVGDGASARAISPGPE